jgi:hypothetical protein
LCIDTIYDIGCRSWKYSLSSKICYLQKDIISVSREGGDDQCQDFSGWVSGDTGLRLSGTRTLPGTVVPGAEFDLMVMGFNLPTEGAVELTGTTPARQRVKIVERTAVCAEGAIADAVVGIGCSHPYFCAPKPSEAYSNNATWSGIKIYSTAALAEYKVCYNMGMTFDRYQWFEVPGLLTVREAMFTWVTEPALLTRKTPDFKLSVMRPSGAALFDFDAAGGDKADWRITIIRSYFDCASVATDTQGIDSANALALEAGGPDVDVGEWPGIRVYAESTRKFAEPGKYQVCWSDGESVPKAIPAADGRLYLEIEAIEGDSSHPRDVFSKQVLSGRREIPGVFDGVNTFTLTGHRLFIPSTSRMTVQAQPCGDMFMDPIVNVAVSESLSSADGYVFEAEVPLGEAGSDFRICYCDSQTDDTLEFSGETYTVSDNSACSDTEVGEVVPTGGLLPKSKVHSDYELDFCAKKCAHGCVGQDCFCDSFDPVAMYDAAKVDDMSFAAPLCLSAPKCRDACMMSPACKRFDFQPETNFCWLLGAEDVAACAAGELRYTETTESWMKLNGTACTNTTDDWREVGIMTLANRVSIGNDWVLTPSAGVGTDYVPVQSLEITGVNMSHSHDRVMFVECTGTCGVSSPAASVRALIGEGTPRTPTVEMFKNWVAVNQDFDAPHEPPTGAEGAGLGLATVTFNTVFGKYCPGNNLDISSPEMYEMGIAQHQCYRKCVVNAPCDEASGECFCSGLFENFDDAESGALCMDQPMCEDACRSLPDCYGIDMHQDQPRCFLNSVNKGVDDELSCSEYDYASLTTYRYNLVVKSMERRARQLSLAPRRLAPGDLLSTDEVLRFRGLAFASGGKFKACFCDFDTLPFGTDSRCLSPSDYKVDIGMVHVSGVSCLIEEKKFQRGECVPQEYGGLRCYPSRDLVPVFTHTIVATAPPAPVTPVTPDPATPVTPVTPVTPDPVTPPAPPPPTGAVLSTFCFYGPEEITRDDPACQYR